MVCQDDLSAFNSVVNGKFALPLSQLFTHLFQSVHRVLHVVTPNYDRLVEYAADHAGFQHDTGFSWGYLRHRRTPLLATSTRASTEMRTVAIAKVHGSLDWFTRSDGTTLGAPLGIDYPASLSPAIVTPGATKYEQAYAEPFRSAIAAADQYLTSAKGYLCLGYGFNDRHIQPKLIERVRQQRVPTVILARRLTDATKVFLETACQSNFVAIEESGSGSKIYSSNNRRGNMFDVGGLWQLKTFMETLVI